MRTAHIVRFQHTAARRRLVAAGDGKPCQFGFNTQPPEGGWMMLGYNDMKAVGFQHTAARRRLVQPKLTLPNWPNRFNTQPPEGGWIPPE